MTTTHKEINMTISFNNGSSFACNSAGEKFHINAAGHLIVTYADNTIEDLGLVVGKDGTDGKSFVPDQIGMDVPDENYQPDQPINWSYLSLASSPIYLYFKTSAPGVNPVTWEKTPFGRGEKGEPGRPFTIDGTGTVLPTDPNVLFDEYTFYNTEDGLLYIYDLDTKSWREPVPFRGSQGPQGQFLINERGTDFPALAGLPIGYTFYATDTGMLYFVEAVPGNPQPPASLTQWSQGILFRGPQGLKGDSIKGDTGAAGKDTKVIVNNIDTSYTNALLVIGTCPAGYVVSHIQVNMEEAYNNDVLDMRVRFGGTVQDEYDGVVIAPNEYFDIRSTYRFIVDEVNHSPSDKDEIISCIFNESVNNATTGKLHIIVSLAWQSAIEPISDNI